MAEALSGADVLFSIMDLRACQKKGIAASFTHRCCYALIVKLREVIRLLFTAIAAWQIFSATPAQAWSWYTEFGFSLAKVTNPANTIDDAPASTFTSPFSIPLTLGFQLQEVGEFPQFQLGLQNRLLKGSGVSTADGSNKTFTTMASYAIARVEFWRLVLGVGYAPYLSKSIAFARREGSSLLLEASFLFPITPEIDFGLSYAQQKFTTPLGSGPSTSEYGGFFRLNFGMSASQKDQKRKFKGWRYPFGNYKN